MTDAARIAALEAEVATLTGTVRGLQEASRQHWRIIWGLTVALGLTWLVVCALVGLALP